MEEEKRKQIEAKLYQLFAETNQDKGAKPPVKHSSGGARLIRRRKGKPDLHIN